jgi:hypothetical protein
MGIADFDISSGQDLSETRWPVEHGIFYLLLPFQMRSIEDERLASSKLSILSMSGC